MDTKEFLNNANRIVVKVGTSTLTHRSGRFNLRLIETLSRVLCDLQNSGKEVILVSSGAIGVGMGKLGLKERPEDTAKKQALAAIGQCELMFMYDKFFGEFNHTVAQVLLTADVLDNPISRKNVQNTFEQLMSIGAIPIVNENDTVATDELEGKHFGDNDTLSALVAKITDADILIILTDIDALYDKDPKQDASAKPIRKVEEITDEIRGLAGGAGSNLGTGGMATKIKAAQISTEASIPCAIIKGDRPENLYDFLEGKEIGTIFLTKTC